MVFTTATFFFMFMPIMIVLYFFSAFLSEKTAFFRKIRIKDLVLLLISLVFYAWTCAENAIWLVIYIAVIYLFGFIVYKTRELKFTLPFDKKRNVFRISSGICFIAVILTLIVLIRYKYSDFLNLNFARLGIKFRKGLMLTAPLGISFIVFTSVSYLEDIKKGRADAGSFLDCAEYISFFPKIVSGPIILWRDFRPQLKHSRTSLHGMVSGINRICTGFAKKVLLADIFGYTIAQIETKGALGIDTFTVWLTVIMYMLQIYYDFAGYSDIAIGLMKILGFDCRENFDFPYRSLSITEFWKRWHISLGSWFREYVYIPLGGSRKGLGRTLLNLAVVYSMTGIWHGASWTYIVWGAINGILVIAERVIMNKPFYKKIPSFVKWLFTMFVVMLFWELFRFPRIQDAADCIRRMFVHSTDHVFFTWRYFLDTRLKFLLLTGILGATVLGSPKLKGLWLKISPTKWGFAVQETVMITLLLLSVIAMISSSYHPFIYFQY